MQKNKRLIAKIFNGEDVLMTIDKNMLSCEFGALDRGNITDVANWGIYANRGSISFIDNVGYFNQQNVNSSTLKNFIVKFYLAKNQEKLISTFKVDTVDFDDETRRVDIQLIGKIIDLQNKPSSLSRKDVFTFHSAGTDFLAGIEEESMEVIGYTSDYPSYGINVGEDAKFFEGTSIYCPYLPYEKAWDRLTKICQATMSRIIEDENGNPIITGERPEKTPIIVNPKNILSISNCDFVKVINPSIDLTNRTRYQNQKVEQASKTLSINYGEDGEPVSVSGADYAFGKLIMADPDILEDTAGMTAYREAIVRYRMRLPYKTFEVREIRSVESLEADRNGDKNYYSTPEAYRSVDNSVLNDTFDNISFAYTFKFLKHILDGSVIKVRSIDFSFYLDCFEDGDIENITKITDSNQEDTTIIDSNDLIQTSSYYMDYPTKIPLGEHILNETVRRYANGRECFEIECLFNDYEFVNGENAFNADDLSSHFKKYDVIIPYVIKKGRRVPLRVNEDGTPKQFRIIGISYSYDGLLKQKLSIQEDRYDVD